MGAGTIVSEGCTRRGLLTATGGALLLAGCGRDDTSGPEEAGGDPVLLVGAVLELSGPRAHLGIQQERALRIAAESLNVSGIQVGNLRRTVRLVVRDNGGDPKTSAAQARELIEEQNVSALVGGVIAENSMAIIGVAQELQVPFISLAAGDDLVLPLSRRTYIYKLTPEARDVARRLAQLIRSQKHQRVAVLAAAGLHGDSGVRALENALGNTGRTLAQVVRLPRSGYSYGEPAGRIAATGADAVVVWSTAPESGAAAVALRRAGYPGPLFFDAGAVAADTISGTAAAAVEGAYVVHPGSLVTSTLTGTSVAALARRDFVSRYRQRYGNYSPFAPYAFDALSLIADAARRAISVDRGRLRAYLQSQVTEGIAGGYSFTPIHHGGMDRDSLGVFSVSRGDWVRVS